MATVHDTEAVDMLKALSGIAIEPGGWRAALSQVCPGWQGNSDPQKGYTDPAAQGQIKVAKAFFDVLDPGYRGIGFDWTKDHGFGPTAVYVEQPNRTGDEIKALIAAALAQATAVVLAE